MRTFILKTIISFKEIVWSAALLFVIFAPNVNLEATGETENLSKQAEVVWSRFDGKNQGVYYSWLSKAGWSNALKLSGASKMNRMPCVCSGSDGSSWAVWTAERGSESDLYYAFSIAGKWIESTKISTGLLINMAPSMVLDPENRPWVVWAGGNGDGNGNDIFCSRWNGSAWEQPLRVNTADATPDIFPLIGIEKGVPRVCWFGFDGTRYRVYCNHWSSQGWHEEIQSDDGGLFTTLINMGIPPLPEFVSDPESACIYVRNRGPLKSILFRYYGLGSLLDRGGENTSEIIKREESVSGDLVILGFGDSITQGYNMITIVGDGRRVGGYEPMLEDLFTTDARPSQVLNWGVGGEKTFQGVNRIDSVLTDPTADYVLILEGTNDFNKNWSWISREETIINLGIMIDKSLAQNITPIISTLTPDTVVDGFDKDLIIRTQYNPDIIVLAADKSVILADQYQGLIANWKTPTDPCTDYSCDGLHPNPEGYAAMAQIWFSVIPGIPSCNGCEGNIVSLKNVVFPAGTKCTCVAGTSITIEDVTIESGADVRFKAPDVNIEKQFIAEIGSSVSIKQN